MNEELVQEAFEQWKNHPTTGLLIKNLQAHKKKCLDIIVNAATDHNIPDISLRYQAVNIKNTERIIGMITQYEIFKQMLAENNLVKKPTK